MATGPPGSGSGGSVSWTAILILSGGAYLFKVVGLVTGDRLSVGLAPAAGLLPAALFAAILAIVSVADGQMLVIDGRLIGVAVGAVAVWRRAPFVVVVVGAMAATALLRLVT
ncbi:MAG: AzlD domain-containing protein [Actinomycetia bacterium]|nr:AzlD domain-containing protein [Actinomycetes bacterium]MCP4844074.1 AzlD domain-containing protein [Actinomycetes bacterium]